MRAFWGAVALAFGLAATLAATAQTEQLREVPFASLKLVSEPAPWQRVAALGGLDGLPSGGVAVSVPCDVDAYLPMWCAPEKVTGVPPEQARAAARLAAFYRFDTTGWRAGVRTVIPIVLTYEPGLDPSAAPAAIEGADVIDWAQRPTGEDLMRYYPARAQRMNIEARAAATCKVLDDLSILCPRVRIQPVEVEGEFFEATARVLRRFRSAPALKDGRPAAGQWFEFTLMFRLPKG